jgi:hypothetical protein
MPMWRMRSCASTRQDTSITQVANVGKVEQKKKYANLLQFGICSKTCTWLILKPSKNYSNFQFLRISFKSISHILLLDNGKGNALHCYK